MSYSNVNLPQGSSFNKVLFMNSHLLNIKVISVLINKYRASKLARHQSTYKITYVKFCSATEKSFYVPILLELSKGAAKIIHKKHSKIKIVQSRCKCNLVSLCFFSGSANKAPIKCKNEDSSALNATPYFLLLFAIRKKYN